MQPERADLLLVGGGLANCLVARRVADADPSARIVVLEAGDRLGGNHTWSLHGTDLAPEQIERLRPMVRYRWDHQRVRFPARERRLDTPYLSLTSDALHRAMVAAGHAEIKTGTRVRSVDAGGATDEQGRRYDGRAVLDGRGPGRDEGLVLGFQKFVGRELELDAPHGLDGPVIMDATVSQQDGYRFVYVLPFSATTVLVEDTRYSDGAALDDDALRRAIDDYAAGRGWNVRRILREERGVLPILLGGDFERFWPADDPVARSGLRAGLFHPTTGYSLPQAVALADAVAAAWPLSGEELAKLTREHARTFWRRTGFYRLLNRMLFRAGRPEHRYRVLQRFYGLPEPLITRFYAERLKLRDRIRLLVGKPPVPLAEALGLIRESSFVAREWNR